MANPLKDTFDACDADKDGKLTEEEFVVFAEKALGISDAAEMFRTMITHYGVKDGKLEWSHLDMLLQSKPTASSSTTSAKSRGRSRSPGARKTAAGSARASSRHRRERPDPLPPTLVDGAGTESVSLDASGGASATSPSAGSTSSTLSTKETGGSRAAALRRARTTGAGYHGRHASRSQSGRSREGSLLDEPLDDIEERSDERSSMSPPPSKEDRSRLRVKPMASPRGLRRTTSIGNEDGSETRGSRSRRKSAAPPQRRRQAGHMRSVTMSDLSGGFDPDSGDDGSAAVLQMLESKLAASQKEAKKERQLRKELEEMSKSVIQQNEECKIKIDTLNKEISFLKKKNSSVEKMMNEKVSELKTEMNGLRLKMKESEKQVSSLLSENETLNRERNEAFKVIRKMESDFESKYKSQQRKHESNVKQITFGLIESIGIELDIEMNADGSVDSVISEVRKLKEKNQVLQKQSDLLAETLSRKEQSLFEALKAVDDISAMDESLVTSLIDSGHHSVLYGISGTAYSTGGSTTGSGSAFGEEDDDDDEMKEGHSTAMVVSPASASAGAAHGRSRSRTSSLFKRLGSIKLRSRVGSGGAAPAAAVASHDGSGSTTSVGGSSDTSHSPAFYKGAHASHDAKLMFEAGKLAAAAQKRGDSKAAAQDMTFLSQSLATDLVSKQDKIDNISVANGVLMKQVHELQVQLDHMRRFQEEALSEMRRSGSSAVSSSKHKSGVLPPPPARLSGRLRTEDEDEDSEPAFSRSADTTDALD